MRDQFDTVLYGTNRNDLFHPFEQSFNKIFDEFFSDGSLSSIKGKVGYPKLDVIQCDGKWLVEVALPGVAIKDVEVEIVEIPKDSMTSSNKGRRHIGRILCISGRMADEHQHSTDANYHVKELRRSSFERKIQLPEYVEGEPEAIMKDGILSLSWDMPELKGPERKMIAVKNMDK